jgi:hypothetical protein
MNDWPTSVLTRVFFAALRSAKTPVMLVVGHTKEYGTKNNN